MVAKMRAKPGGERIPVTIGDMADVPLDGPFGLVYVAFNTMFSLPSQAAQVSCFRNVARVLAPGGLFCLECFVPDTARFDRGQSLRVMSITLDDVRLDVSKHDPVNQRVDASRIHLGNGSVSVRPIRLRYAWPSELDLMGELAGFRLRDRWGGWGQQPFTESSGTHVSVYAKR
jgi:SAM-dependent methyltransferase